MRTPSHATLPTIQCSRKCFWVLSRQSKAPLCPSTPWPWPGLIQCRMPTAAPSIASRPPASTKGEAGRQLSRPTPAGAHELADAGRRALHPQRRSGVVTSAGRYQGGQVRGDDGGARGEQRDHAEHDGEVTRDDDRGDADSHDDESGRDLDGRGGDLRQRAGRGDLQCRHHQPTDHERDAGPSRPDPQPALPIKHERSLEQGKARRGGSNQTEQPMQPLARSSGPVTTDTAAVAVTERRV